MPEFYHARPGAPDVAAEFMHTGYDARLKFIGGCSPKKILAYDAFCAGLRQLDAESHQILRAEVDLNIRSAANGTTDRNLDEAGDIIHAQETLKGDIAVWDRITGYRH